MNRANLPISASDQPVTVPEHEREIAELVHRFYTLARQDPVLGPVFDRQVKDWDKHLSTMCDFWSSAVYRTGRYSGRPLDAHRRVADIQPEHFPRWLGLWQQTVDEVVRSEAHGPLKDFASRMASTMSTRLGLSPSSGDNG